MTASDDPVKFLLVDDLEENLIALEALLQRDGLIFLKARSGEEALEHLLVHDVALALLDVQMPGMDGFQLAEIMRANSRARHVPIIFVTAGAADAGRQFRGYEAGAVDFIQKPISAPILQGKAAVFFDLHRQRQEILAQRDELQTLTAALRLADRHKNQFLAVLGHELRNPVMALRAGLHLSRKAVTSDKVDDIRRRMEVQISHLSRLVEDLLDISRIDQGKIVLRTERITLQSVVEAAVDAGRPLVDAGGHALTLSIPEEDVWLLADPLRLSQVLINLLNNAAKYTPKGGEISLVVSSAPDVVDIAVSDNGIGVNEDMQAKIFELFAQVKGPDSRSQDGLGIGLALVKQLVELHGGSISLASAGEGQGSTFTVRLPTAL